MKTRSIRLTLGLSLVAATALVWHGLQSSQIQAAEEAPFGGAQDVAFAESLWEAMDGYQEWPMQSDVYEGGPPHGKFLRLYYNYVHVDGKAYHAIVKDNFGGDEATAEAVSASPEEYLAAVTIMLEREPGYDPDNGNWFWVKYQPDGNIAANPNGMKLAGRVAKGSPQGCIACHRQAGGDDYVFANDQ